MFVPSSLRLFRGIVDARVTRALVRGPRLGIATNVQASDVLAAGSAIRDRRAFRPRSDRAALVHGQSYPSSSMCSVGAVASWWPTLPTQHFARGPIAPQRRSSDE